MKRTTVRLPDKLLARAKKKAAAEGTTLTALIEEGLRLVLLPKKQEVSDDDEVVLPRVSKARGGLMPGIDPLKLNTQTQDMDDIEMMERVARQVARK